MKLIQCKVGDRVRIPKFSALFPEGELLEEDDEAQAKIVYIVQAVEPVDAEDSIRNYGEVIEGLADLDLMEEIGGGYFPYCIDNSLVELVD